MQFPKALVRGTLVKRYKRFLADVELADGGVVTAHCPNPGSMMGLKDPGAEVWISPVDDPNRKLRYTLELVRTPGSLVGVNTGHPNRLARDAIEAGLVTELAGYFDIRREVRYGVNSRIDLLLEAPAQPPCYVEVKNVTLKRDSHIPGLAEFPDAVTRRGAKHLVELTAMVRQGGRAVMLYIAQREDCDRLAVADDIDPAYGKAFSEALAAGVEAICYACTVRPEGIELDKPLPVVI